MGGKKARKQKEASKRKKAKGRKQKEESKQSNVKKKLSGTRSDGFFHVLSLLSLSSLFSLSLP